MRTIVGGVSRYETTANTADELANVIISGKDFRSPLNASQEADLTPQQRRAVLQMAISPSRESNEHAAALISSYKDTPLLQNVIDIAHKAPKSQEAARNSALHTLDAIVMLGSSMSYDAARNIANLPQDKRVEWTDYRALDRIFRGIAAGHRNISKPDEVYGGGIRSCAAKMLVGTDNVKVLEQLADYIISGDFKRDAYCAIRHGVREALRTALGSNRHIKLQERIAEALPNRVTTWTSEGKTEGACYLIECLKSSTSPLVQRKLELLARDRNVPAVSVRAEIALGRRLSERNVAHLKAHYNLGEHKIFLEDNQRLVQEASEKGLL